MTACKHQLPSTTPTIKSDLPRVSAQVDLRALPLVEMVIPIDAKHKNGALRLVNQTLYPLFETYSNLNSSAILPFLPFLQYIYHPPTHRIDPLHRNPLQDPQVPPYNPCNLSRPHQPRPLLRPESPLLPKDPDRSLRIQLRLSRD